VGVRSSPNQASGGGASGLGAATVADSGISEAFMFSDGVEELLVAIALRVAVAPLWLHKRMSLFRWSRLFEGLAGRKLGEMNDEDQCDTS